MLCSAGPEPGAVMPAQWCRPSRRQHAGRFDCRSEPNNGLSSDRPNKASSIAAEKRRNVKRSFNAIRLIYDVRKPDFFRQKRQHRAELNGGRRTALRMSAPRGNNKHNIRLLSQQQRGAETNKTIPQWRRKACHRMPCHQTESRIQRTLPVASEPTLTSGILVRSHATPMHTRTSAARRNSRLGIRPESRSDQRKRQQHQQRNGGELPQSIYISANSRAISSYDRQRAS